MKWTEVFDKYFIIQGDENNALVFVPGSYTGSHIWYVWTTPEKALEGVDFSLLHKTRYATYGEEVGSIFSNWVGLEKLSQEEKVCRKIRVMKERWDKFQENKKATTIVIKDRTGTSFTYCYDATISNYW